MLIVGWMLEKLVDIYRSYWYCEIFNYLLNGISVDYVMIDVNCPLKVVIKNYCSSFLKVTKQYEMSNR